jgi:2-polyprenyl-3-methyl-5-hydroxy-6-metoxy-1,4-benzoquinol methylase
VWLNPRPSVASLPVIYPPTYYAYNYKEQIHPIAVWAKEVLDLFKMKNILRQLPAMPQSYLDIGCGDGRFLKVMEKQGVSKDKNYGLELDERVTQQLSEAGYQVICQRVEDCTTLPENKIDLATMFHVIEHVDDPGAVVHKVAQWLSPGGVFAIETPNIDSFDTRLFKQTYWGGYHFPRHWNLFTPATLARLLSDNGLQVVFTQYQTGHSFWMWSFHHWLRYSSNGTPRLGQIFNPTRGLPFLALFTAFDILRSRLSFRTSSMLMLARKPNQG